MDQSEGILLHPGSHGQQLSVRAERQTIYRGCQVHERVQRAGRTSCQWSVCCCICRQALLSVIYIDHTAVGACCKEGARVGASQSCAVEAPLIYLPVDAAPGAQVPGVHHAITTCNSCYQIENTAATLCLRTAANVYESAWEYTHVCNNAKGCVSTAGKQWPKWHHCALCLK